MPNAVTKFFAVITLLMTLLCWGIDFPGKFVFQMLFSWSYLFLVIKYFILTRKYSVNADLRKKECIWIRFFLLWVFLSMIGGIFMARNYYEYKHLILNTPGLLAPLLVIPFSNQKMFINVWKLWFKYAIIIGLLLFPIIGLSLFYYAPLLIVLVLRPIFSKRKRILILILTVACFGYALLFIDCNEHVIKLVVSFGLGMLLLLNRMSKPQFAKKIQVCCYLFVFIIFTILLPTFWQTMKGKNSDVDLEAKVMGVHLVDTRSLLLFDVVESALNNHYVIWGRTPARGNDINLSSFLFMNPDEDGYIDDAEFVGNERTANEMSFPNVFTWTGLIGLFLYMMIYFKGSYLAVYKSNNKYMRIIGCFVAFRWSIGWLLDYNAFDITNITLWTMIALCYSPEVRKMKDPEFKSCFRKILN